MESQEASEWYAKLYFQGEDSWNEKGAGYISCCFLQESEVACIRARDVNNSEILLESPIHLDCEYNCVTKDNTIFWNDIGSQISMAAVFQDQTGCMEIWEVLSGVQDKMLEALPQLPEVNKENLDEIMNILSKTYESTLRDGVINALRLHNCLFIQRFEPLFNEAEKAKDVDSLEKMFVIFKHICLMDVPDFFNSFIYNFFDWFVGICEYDPDVPFDIDHREYLNHIVQFKQVVPINNDTVITRITANFRLQYLRDNLMPRLLHDGCNQTINSLIFANNLEIIQYLHGDTEYMKTLFTRVETLIDEGHSVERTEALEYLAEMFRLARSFGRDHSEFMCTIVQSANDFFEYIRRVFADENASNRELNACHFMLEECVWRHTSFIRSYMINHHVESPSLSSDGEAPVLSKQPPKNGSLLLQIIWRMLFDKEIACQQHMFAVLEDIACSPIPVPEDPQNQTEEEISTQKEEEEFLDLFYSYYFPFLLTALVENGSKKKQLQSATSIAAKTHLAQFLVCCVCQHKFRMRHFALKHSVLARVMKLFAMSQPQLKICSLNLLRGFIVQSDDCYHRMLIRSNAFQPVLEFFSKNRKKDNLLISSLLDLFSAIIKHARKNIISHLLDNFAKLFKEWDVAPFNMMEQALIDIETKEKDLKEQTKIDLNSSTINVPFGQAMSEDDDGEYFEGEEEEDMELDPMFGNNVDEEDMEDDNFLNMSFSSAIDDDDEDGFLLSDKRHSEKESDTVSEKESVKDVIGPQKPIRDSPRPISRTKKQQRMLFTFGEGASKLANALSNEPPPASSSSTSSKQSQQQSASDSNSLPVISAVTTKESLLASVNNTSPLTFIPHPYGDNVEAPSSIKNAQKNIIVSNNEDPSNIKEKTAKDEQKNLKCATEDSTSAFYEKLKDSMKKPMDQTEHELSDDEDDLFTTSPQPLTRKRSESVGSQPASESPVKKSKFA